MSEKTVSEKKAKQDFRFTGLSFFLYAAALLYIPHLFLLYMRDGIPEIMENRILYFGIYYIFLLVGNLLPILLLKNRFSIKMKQFMGAIGDSLATIIGQTLVFFAIVTASMYISNTIGGYLNLEETLLSNIGTPLRAEYLDSPLFVFMFTAACPLLEEVLYRGVLLSALRRYGSFFALFVTTLLFALAHSAFTDFLPAAVMGFLLGKIALRYRSIQPTIAIHILFNLFLYFLAVAPASVTKYMQYGLLVVYLGAIIFLLINHGLTGYRVSRSANSMFALKLFFTRFSVILVIILLIGHSFLLLFLP